MSTGDREKYVGSKLEDKIRNTEIRNKMKVPDIVARIEQKWSQK